jgi:hypothetical protein
MRESARTVANSLPRGTYLLRVDPSAVECDRLEFTAHVQLALQAAGHAKSGRPA